MSSSTVISMDTLALIIMGWSQCMEAMTLDIRMTEGSRSLSFILAYDLCISNSFFMKSEEHLITFKSGTNKRQINFFLLKKSEHLYCKNCKVNPGAPILTQHWLLTLGIMIKRWKRQRMSKCDTRIRWWKLNGAATKDFEKKLS